MGPKEEFTFPQEWKRKSVLFAIRARHDNATIVKFFDLTTMWVWKVRNQLEESGGDTKLWQKDLSKSMRVIANDTKMCLRGLEVQVLQNEKKPTTDSQGQEAIKVLSKTSQQAQTSSAV